jgi:hypothetical protein
MCGKARAVRRNAPTDGDMSVEPGRGLKFGEPVVGKVETLD